MVSVEGSSITSDGKVSFQVQFDIESARRETFLDESDKLMIEVIASSSFRTWSKSCFKQNLTSQITEVELELGSIPSLHSLQFDVLVYVALARARSSFVPGQPVLDHSILAKQRIKAASVGARIPFFNIQVQEFPADISDSLWEIVLDYDLLAELDVLEQSKLDISRVFAIRVNSLKINEFEDNGLIQSLIVADLAIKSLENFFSLPISAQAEVLQMIGGRKPFEGNWFRWLQWQFRDAFGQPFIEANRLNLGIVTNQWNQNRLAVEARIRSKVLARGAR
jgi:hypothetical protein